MQKRSVVKFVASTIVGSGTGVIIKAIVKNNVDLDEPKNVVPAYSAAFVLGAMAADVSRQYISRSVDDVCNLIDKLVKKTPAE